MPEGPVRDPQASARRLSNLGIVLLLDPDQHDRRMAGLERTLRSLHDLAIQSITVCERACRYERDESEPTATAIIREMSVMPTVHLPRGH